MHGGSSPGAPLGNQNALKHGHYSRTARDRRALVRKLLRDVLHKRIRE